MKVEDDSQEVLTTLQQLKKFSTRKQKNILYYYILICIGMIGQSMAVSGALEVSITRIEKAFNLNSFHVSFISLAYNTGFVIGSLLIGYFSPKRKIRIIGFGSLFISIGSLIFIIPVFLDPNSNDTAQSYSFLCRAADKFAASVHLTSFFGKIFIMCVAYFLAGLGACTFFTLAVTYIEEVNMKNSFGLKCAIFYATSLIGPVVCFFTYTHIIKLPYKFFLKEDIFIDHTDENWVGAYWLIYVFVMGFNFLAAVPMLLSKQYSYTEIPVSQRSITSLDYSLSFWAMIKRTFNNKPFLFLCFGMYFDGLMSNSVLLFITKYIESQFRLETSKAATYTGIMAISGAVVGLLSSGIYIKYYNVSKLLIMKMIVILYVMGIASLGVLFLRCPNINIKGIERSSSKNYLFNTTCALDCDCNIQDYLPVCVNETETYYSPCSIGCKAQQRIGDGLTFYQCTCLGDDYANYSVTQGSCKVKCYIFEIFMAFTFVAIAIQFAVYIPQLTFTLEILQGQIKLFGIAFQQILIRFSFIIGPLMFGKLLDLSCFLFKSVDNDQFSGNCLLYHLKNLSFISSVYTIITKTIGTVFIALAYYFYCQENTDEEEPPT